MGVILLHIVYGKLPAIRQTVYLDYLPSPCGDVDDVAPGGSCFVAAFSRTELNRFPGEVVIVHKRATFAPGDAFAVPKEMAEYCLSFFLGVALPDFVAY